MSRPTHGFALEQLCGPLRIYLGQVELKRALLSAVIWVLQVDALNLVMVSSNMKDVCES